MDNDKQVLPMNMSDTFHAIFGRDATYDQKSLKKITRSRQELENLLFVDRLLSALGVEHRRPKPRFFA